MYSLSPASYARYRFPYNINRRSGGRHTGSWPTTKRPPAEAGGLLVLYCKRWLGRTRLVVLITAVHAAVAASRDRGLGLGKVGNQGFGGKEETGDRGRVLQRR